MVYVRSPGHQKTSLNKVSHGCNTVTNTYITSHKAMLTKVKSHSFNDGEKAIFDDLSGDAEDINFIRMLKIPSPRLDQVQMAFRTHPDAVDLELTKSFGVGCTCAKYGREKIFSGGVYLKKGREPGWNVVQFDGGKAELLDEIHSVANRLFANGRSSKRSHRQTKPRQTISLVELAWDIPFVDYTYQQVETRLRGLAKHLIPKNARARFRFKSGKIEQTKDGATNGKVTFYFQSEKEGQTGPCKSWTTKTKTYAKKYDGIWHVRIEVTLRRQAVRKAFGTSRDIVALATKAARQDWRDYFHFEAIDYEGFVQESRVLMGKLSIGRRRYLRQLFQQGMDISAVEQKHYMRDISKYLQSDRLQRRIKDFCLPINICPGRPCKKPTLYLFQ